MGYSMLALTLAIRLAWYNFDEKLANASNGSSEPKSQTSPDAPASGAESGSAAGSNANTKNKGIKIAVAREHHPAQRELQPAQMGLHPAPQKPRPAQRQNLNGRKGGQRQS
jgi:hypothetical protein